jgi:hypothetical protein
MDQARINADSGARSARVLKSPVWLPWNTSTTGKSGITMREPE